MNNKKEYYAFILKEIREEQRYLNKSFLNTKLAFTAFLGVIFTIVFSNDDIFGNRFKVILVIITIITFSFLFITFWMRMRDVEKGALKLKEIDENFKPKKRWRFWIILWGLLFISVPILFLIKLLSLV